MDKALKLILWLPNRVASIVMDAVFDKIDCENPQAVTTRRR